MQMDTFDVRTFFFIEQLSDYLICFPSIFDNKI